MPGDEAPKLDAEAQFRDLLCDAVALRTRSDVPIGACVSGGLDSSAIVRLLDRSGSEPIHCFSTAYDDPTYDESRYAALAARSNGLVVHRVRPDPSDMLETIGKIVWHHDAPTPMRGRFAQWFVMREAGRHVKVVMDGQGGDELLGGYVQDTVFYLSDRIRRGAWRPREWTRLRREIAELALVEGSLRWFLLMAPRRYLRDPRAHGSRPFESALNNVLWNGLCREGLPEILRSEDALSMAFSVESRTPFLDHRLVEFCFTLPFGEKISDGWTKSLLRRSLRGVIPAEILARRRKFGLGSPLVPWLRLAPNWLAVRELLLDPRSLGRGILKAGTVERGLKAFGLGRRVYTSQRVMRLWRWLTLELWFRQLIDPVAVTGHLLPRA
jgi:asparagine synthase (glutamine-hydrolysing)